MRGTFPAIFALCALLGTTPSPAIIYGSDDRLEYYEIVQPTVIGAMDTVVGLFSSTQVAPAAGGGYDIDTGHYGTYGDYNSLCSSEPYRQQPAPAFCSGFQIGPDLIATAGHCVDSCTCPDAIFVFGFWMEDPVTPRTHVGDDDVYQCAEVVAHQNSSTVDFSIVRVDRPISGHAPLPIRTSGSVESDPVVNELILIGHAAGMPMKIAGGAAVKDASHPDIFNANLDAYAFEAGLDAYAGNSGSMVASLDVLGNLHLVEGILARGNNPDYVLNSGLGCHESNLCPDSGCPGWEKVTRTTSFEQYLASPPPICGNGAIEPGEECDDGGTTDGDGCAMVCTIEPLPEVTDLRAIPQFGTPAFDWAWDIHLGVPNTFAVTGFTKSSLPAATCIERDDGTDTRAVAPRVLLPGEIEYILVRPEVTCPRVRGPLGNTSDGTPRIGPPCDLGPIPELVPDANPAGCGQVITFDATGSSHTNPTHRIQHWSYDFGDGNTADFSTPDPADPIPSPSHSYDMFGVYPVMLTVTDDTIPPKIETVGLTIDVNQGNQPPMAEPGGAYLTSVGGSVLLDAGLSSDPDAACGDSIAEYGWDLNLDGIMDVVSPAPVTLVEWPLLDSLNPPLLFPADPGTGMPTNTIRLHVFDTFGAESTAETELTIFP